MLKFSRNLTVTIWPILSKGTDDSNVFASEHIRLKPAEEKQKTNKQTKNLKEENNYFV